MAHLVAQQILDVVHLDVVHLDAMLLLDVVVDAEPRLQLKTDYFRDVVDVEVLHLQKMDCYQDEEQRVLLGLVALLALLVWNLREQSLLVSLLVQLLHLQPLLHEKL